MGKKDSKGRYVSTFTFNKKRYYVRAKSKEELLIKETEKREQLKKGYNKIYNPTLSEYYDHFTEIRRNQIKESTLRSQQSQIKTVLNHKMEDNTCFGDMKIKEITRRDIERVRQELLSEGKTPQNLNNIFAHLNHVLNKAFLDETIEKNPCKALEQLKRDAPPISETKHRALSIEETNRFFTAAKESNSYYYNCFLFMIKSGVRIGELTALTKADIDTKNGFVHINKTIQRNEAGSYIVGDSTKTRNGKRDIPLTEELLDIVKSQEELNCTLFGKPKNVISADVKQRLLFKSFEGKILREYTLNREIKRICKSAGIEKFTCHAFRNTFATRWIEQRPQDYKILSEILGHKDVSITLNLYTHVMKENKVNAMNEVNISVNVG